MSHETSERAEYFSPSKNAEISERLPHFGTENKMFLFMTQKINVLNY